MITLAVLLLLLSKSETADQVKPQDYATAFDQLFKEYAVLYDLDWKLVKAIAMNESGLGVVPGGILPSVLEGLKNPSNVAGSTSSDGKSWGLMQVTLPTGRQFDASCTPERLNDPTFCVGVACQYIQWLTERFNTTDPRYTEWVVKSYNQGIGNTLNEQRGGSGYANEYWARFQRNYARV